MDLKWTLVFRALYEILRLVKKGSEETQLERDLRHAADLPEYRTEPRSWLP